MEGLTTRRRRRSRGSDAKRLLRNCDLSPFTPKLQRGPTGDALEIIVGGQHREVMADANLRQQGIDRSNLNPRAPAAVSQLGRLDVIVSIWDDEGQSRKPIQDLRASFGTRKSLQQFLKDETGREDRFARLNRAHERSGFRRSSNRVAPQRQRPHTGIDKKAQSRVRSALWS